MYFSRFFSHFPRQNINVRTKDEFKNGSPSRNDLSAIKYLLLRRSLLIYVSGFNKPRALHGHREYFIEKKKKTFF